MNIPDKRIMYAGSLCIGTCLRRCQQFSWTHGMPSSWQKYCLLQSLPCSTLYQCRSLKAAWRMLPTATEAHLENSQTSFLHLTNRECSVSCKQAFAVTKVSAQLSRTSPPALERIDTMSIIYPNDFCSGRSRIFSVKLSVNAVNSRSSGGSREKFFIASFHHWVFQLLSFGLCSLLDLEVLPYDAPDLQKCVAISTVDLHDVRFSAVVC